MAGSVRPRRSTSLLALGRTGIPVGPFDRPGLAARIAREAEWRRLLRAPAEIARELRGG